MTFLSSLPDDAQIFDVFSTRPELYEPFVQMVERASRGDSALSPGERELIGAYVSELNRCPLCVDIHASAAKAHGVDASAAREKLRPLLDYVGKLTEHPNRVGPSDAQAVYDAGFDEDALHDAVVIACIAGFMNRFVFGLGIEAADAYKEAAGRAIEREGYRSRFDARLRSGDDAEE